MGNKTEYEKSKELLEELNRPEYKGIQRLD